MVFWVRLGGWIGRIIAPGEVLGGPERVPGGSPEAPGRVPEGSWEGPGRVPGGAVGAMGGPWEVPGGAEEAMSDLSLCFPMFWGHWTL